MKKDVSILRYFPLMFANTCAPQESQGTIICQAEHTGEISCCALSSKRGTVEGDRFTQRHKLNSKCNKNNYKKLKRKEVAGQKLELLFALSLPASLTPNSVDKDVSK